MTKFPQAPVALTFGAEAKLVTSIAAGHESCVCFIFHCKRVKESLARGGLAAITYHMARLEVGLARPAHGATEKLVVGGLYEPKQLLPNCHEQSLQKTAEMLQNETPS